MVKNRAISLLTMQQLNGLYAKYIINEIRDVELYEKDDRNSFKIA